VALATVHFGRISVLPGGQCEGLGAFDKRVGRRRKFWLVSLHSR
jgi:hypothetical protein